MRRVAPLLLFLAACGGETVRPSPDASADSDAGVFTPRDASTAPDSGEGLPDADVELDAGAEADAGAETDAGEPLDAGAPDGGPAPEDAGPAPIDAGSPDAGSPPTVPDPEQPGPLPTANHAETIRVAASRHDLGLDCYYPTSPGAYPLVLVMHGFQLPGSQYTSYATHLARFGYVACTVDYETSALRANHVENAQDVRAGVDRLLAANQDAAHPLQGKVDEALIGLMGHSLGGKVSFLAAEQDMRIGAVLGLDPVDGAPPLCPGSRCPDASALLPFSIPVAVLGETLDGGSGQVCAPTADNFQTFYAAASSPAVEVDVLGANHMSFIDDPSTCGLACLFCNPSVAAQEDVLRLARAMTVAFFERHLKGDAAYEPYLTGNQAQARYVATGLANIQSK